MKTVFCTYGLGRRNYVSAARRLSRQAVSLGVFSEVRCVLQQDLKADTGFWRAHRKFMDRNRKGFGFYIWKPYLFRKLVHGCTAGDQVVLLDAGCEISPESRELFLAYLERSGTDLIIGANGFSRESGPYLEKFRSKADLVHHLGMQSEAAALNSRQYESGMNIFHVNELIRDFADAWYETACSYPLLDDSPSTNHRDPEGFLGHRHDQSIFSLLRKKFGIESGSLSMYDLIAVTRNRGGRSYLGRLDTLRKSPLYPSFVVNKS